MQVQISTMMSMVPDCDGRGSWTPDEVLLEMQENKIKEKRA